MAGRPGQASDDYDYSSWLEAAVRGLILAVITPDNTPHGYNLTYGFPMVLFIIVALILYLLFSRPHRRVPAQTISLPARSARPPGPGAARAAATAGGLSAAPGGGATESHLEPQGAHLVASTDAEPVDTTPAGQAGQAGQAESGDQAEPGGTEGSEGPADPKDGEGTE
jgi:hypothetical protein